MGAHGCSVLFSKTQSDSTSGAEPNYTVVSNPPKSQSHRRRIGTTPLRAPIGYGGTVAYISAPAAHVTTNTCIGAHQKPPPAGKRDRRRLEGAEIHQPYHQSFFCPSISRGKLKQTSSSSKLKKMFYGGRYAFHRNNSFQQTYRCYPPSFVDKPHLEGGDKVIMPQSALARLASLRIEYPMLFELRKQRSDDDAAQQQQQRVSHCGVLEFVVEEGAIIMPYWMMHNMRLQEGDIVHVKNAALPKGTYVKLQPHTAAFLDVSNPKAILERTLRSFTCLTTGDSIMVAYNGKQYYIDIVETRPASAVCIIDTDCEVDFAPPLDYKEPEKKPRQPTVPATASNKAEDGKTATVVEDEPKFKPFTGSGKRLDGKDSKLQASDQVPSTALSAPLSDSNSNKRANQQISALAAAASVASSNYSRHKTGKLVFGSSASNSNKELPKAPAKVEEPAKKDEPRFQAFSGKSYSLKL